MTSKDQSMLRDTVTVIEIFTDITRMSLKKLVAEDIRSATN